MKRNAVESAFVNEFSKSKIKSTTSYELIDLSKLEKNSEGEVDSSKIAEIKKKLNDAGYDRITSYNVCYTKLLRKCPT